MWKKLIPAALVLLMTLWAGCAMAATLGDYGYEVKPDGTAIITFYTGSDKEVTVPGSLDSHTVT